MKLVKPLFLLLVLFAFGTVNAQNLQYNASLIVGNTTMTVPAGQTWKVTGLYGEEYRYNECIDVSATSSDELNRIRCAYTSGSTARWTRLSYAISTMIVNGTNIVSKVSGLREGSYNVSFYNDAACSSYWTYVNTDVSCGNSASDPNQFPMWLPAGTTIQSGGPNTYVSVLAFDIIP